MLEPLSIWFWQASSCLLRPNGAKAEVNTEVKVYLCSYVFEKKLEPLSGPRVFGHAQWRKDWVKVFSELAQDRRAWSTSVHVVVNSIGDAGSTRPGWMPTQVQLSKTVLKIKPTKNRMA